MRRHAHPPQAKASDCETRRRWEVLEHRQSQAREEKTSGGKASAREYKGNIEHRRTELERANHMRRRDRQHGTNRMKRPVEHNHTHAQSRTLVVSGKVRAKEAQQDDRS